MYIQHEHTYTIQVIQFQRFLMKDTFNYVYNHLTYVVRSRSQAGWPYKVGQRYPYDDHAARAVKIRQAN